MCQELQCPQRQSISKEEFLYNEFTTAEKEIINNRWNSEEENEEYLNLCARNWSVDTILVTFENLSNQPVFFLDPDNKGFYEELINNPEHEAIEGSLFHILMLNAQDEILLLNYDKDFYPTPYGAKWNIVSEILRGNRKGKFIEGIKDHLENNLGLRLNNVDDLEVEMFDRFLQNGASFLRPFGNYERRYYILQFNEDHQEVLNSLEAKGTVKEVGWFQLEEVIERFEKLNPDISYEVDSAIKTYQNPRHRRLKEPIKIKI